MIRWFRYLFVFGAVLQGLLMAAAGIALLGGSDAFDAEDFYRAGFFLLVNVLGLIAWPTDEVPA